MDNYLPGLLKEAPLAEFMGLIAPRPLLIESGTEDEIFPVEYVKIAYRRLEKVCNFLNISYRLVSHIFRGRHEVRKDKVNDWFEKNLVQELNN